MPVVSRRLIYLFCVSACWSPPTTRPEMQPSATADVDSVTVTDLVGEGFSAVADLPEVTDLTLDRNGGFLVVSRTTAQLLSISRAGRLRFVVDSSDEVGLTWPVRVGTVADSIWVVDATRRHVVLFNSVGEMLHSRSPKSPQVGRYLQPGDPSALLADGRFLAEPRYAYGPDLAQRLPSVPLLLCIDGIRQVDTLMTFSVGSRTLVLRDPDDVSGMGGTLYTANPLGTPTLFSASGDGEFVAWAAVPDDTMTSTFDIGLLKVREDAHRSWSVSYIPTPVPPAVVDSAAAHVARDVRQAFPRSGLNEIRAWVRAGLGHPRYLGPVSAVIVDEAGSGLWVGREKSVDVATTWERYTDSGELSRRIPISREVTIHAAVADTLFGIRRDAAGALRLVRTVVHRR